jgi:hypothetical protein
MTPKNITHLKALSSLVIALTIGLSATAAEKVHPLFTRQST